MDITIRNQEHKDTKNVEQHGTHGNKTGGDLRCLYVNTVPMNMIYSRFVIALIKFTCTSTVANDKYSYQLAKRIHSEIFNKNTGFIGM